MLLRQLELEIFFQAEMDSTPKIIPGSVEKSLVVTIIKLL